MVALFEKRVFDDYLYSLSEECPAQLDLSKVSELSAILSKHKASVEKVGCSFFFEPVDKPHQRNNKRFSIVDINFSWFASLISKK